MSDEASEQLVLSGKEGLLAYARSAFEAMDCLVAQVSAEQLLQSPGDPQNHPHVLALLKDGLTHVNRHLGMVEALRGLLGLKGTATR